MIKARGKEEILREREEVFLCRNVKIYKKFVLALARPGNSTHVWYLRHTKLPKHARQIDGGGGFAMKLQRRSHVHKDNSGVLFELLAN